MATATALEIEKGDPKYIVKEGSGARYRGSDVSDRIIQLYGDSATFDFPLPGYRRRGVRRRLALV